MKTYSLYLSTMTGANIQAVFTGTITGVNTLTVAANTSGTVAANQYIDNLQRLILQYLLSRGATIGLKDVIISKEALKKCKDMLRTKKIEVECMLTEIENNPDLIDPDIIEKNMTSLLQSVTGEITKVTMADLKGIEYTGVDPIKGIYSRKKSYSIGAIGIPTKTIEKLNIPEIIQILKNI